jgi:hypothetical protein
MMEQADPVVVVVPVGLAAEGAAEEGLVSLALEPMVREVSGQAVTTNV